ncbi:uncharacterized protein Z518_07064 [Rhinocladiella mackenziei CBS 650.93]|uniref:Zinc finger Mcm10/DnaG-type domain-containing protein n=1 Tax=Rhinocladiella mackenziei CBS 650.93 TaxID=1442369 RepID=A0A0D2IJX7_9EURO|nr:uncharacterized protein Z518_07064 [Rhinocladiella mackenziei CBS 650.93]KIX03511.1 hypothetical protein Z518_07064 [Rhinocladiella mackenziei CBS 650.93]
MSHDIPWPPMSPHAAILSSPSGRKKHGALQNSASPTKHLATTPSITDHLRTARRDRDFSPQEQDMQEDLEEDEEMLQLKLAAIEAKLKLKKLQQNKARAATPGRGSSRPSSVHGPDSTSSRLLSMHQEPITQIPHVEVRGSPTKRLQTAPQPKPSSRVLLGIDQGLRGSDVSLRRANTTSGSTRQRKENLLSGGDRPLSRSSAFNSARSVVSSKSNSRTETRKTFSERMVEAREREVNNGSQREAINRNRSNGFELDQTEIESYRLLAEESRPHEHPRSPTRLQHRAGYSRNEVLSAAAEANSGIRHLRKTRSLSEIQEGVSKLSQQPEEIETQRADAALFEGFSQLHLSSRILPHTFLKRTLPSDRFTIYRIPDLLKAVTSPDYELPDGVCDYVVFGAIASKSSPMDHKKRTTDTTTVGTNDWERQWEDGSRNQRLFMVFTLTDLKWTIDLYLFDTALPRYHRLTPGTVIAILNPQIMPPKPGKTDTGAFSLTLHDGDDTVLEIGTARDLGYCKTLKKDGKECGSWVDASKTGICEWHLNAQLDKTRARRMGVNAGTNGYGRHNFYDKNSKGNGLLSKDGRRYDPNSGSHFYIAKSNTGASHGSRPGQKRGGFLDEDDPFIPEGQLQRDRDARVRKHLAAQEKEREIAEKLGSSHSLGFGSAGAEYLRQKAKDRTQDKDEDRETAAKSNDGSASTSISQHNPVSMSREANYQHHRQQHQEGGSQGSSLARATSILNTGGTRKRTARDVRLSPVKKTRFVTEKGIREAGRESLGVAGAQPLGDSDDELEIV